MCYYTIEAKKFKRQPAKTAKLLYRLAGMDVQAASDFQIDAIAAAGRIGRQKVHRFCDFFRRANAAQGIGLINIGVAQADGQTLLTRILYFP